MIDDFGLLITRARNEVPSTTNTVNGRLFVVMPAAIILDLYIFLKLPRVEPLRQIGDTCAVDSCRVNNVYLAVL